MYNIILLVFFIIKQCNIKYFLSASINRVKLDWSDGTPEHAFKSGMNGKPTYDDCFTVKTKKPVAK
jgi:hypothetical protein